MAHAIDGIMVLNRPLAAAIAALAAGLAVPAIGAEAQPGATAITCTNPASGASWQINIDYDKATVDSNPASISDAKISWHDAKDGGNYTLDRKSGDLTVDRRVEHRRLFRLRSLQAGELTAMIRCARRTSGATAERWRWLRVSPASRPASGSPRRPGRASATRISPAPFSAPSCPSRAARWSRRSPTASAAPRAAASRPRPRCAAFSTDFATCPRPWRCGAPAATIVNALNGWIHSQGRQDPELAGMGCTFTALVLRGRVAHLLHVGDTRAYRLSGDRLTCLTTDHVREDGAGRSRVLTRALGVEAEVRLDYATQPVALHDRFLLCSDGVHGFLTDESIADILRERSAPGDTARALVAAALDAGGTDNCTALVLDVVGLPTAESADIGSAIMQLPLIPVPHRRRDDRRLRAQGAAVRRPLQPAVRRAWTRSRAARWR